MNLNKAFLELDIEIDSTNIGKINIDLLKTKYRKHRKLYKFNRERRF